MITVRFTLAREDWIRIYREYFFWRSSRLRMFRVYFVLPLVLVAALAASRREGWESWLGTMAAAVLVASVGFPLGLAWRRRYLGSRLPALAYDRMDPERRGLERTFVFREEGFEASSTMEQAKGDWQAWTGYRELGSLFAVFPTSARNVFIPIPKSAFASEADLAAFRDLLSRKLKRVGSP